MPGPWLVLPTYNEAENIEPITEAAVRELATAAADHTILIVDDNSPDGTGEIADRLAAEHPQVEVLHRAGKEGLGRAYLAGFARALADGAELVLEMDADFSHDPADLPRLIEAAGDADVILGSRYAAGGGVAGWTAGRRALSRGGSWYARTVLGIGVRDLTGGFKCFRRRVLEELDLDDVHADGYGFQIEMTYRAVRAGFRVREIPIVFHDRRAGESKMDARIAAEAVWKVPTLRWRLRGRGRRQVTAGSAP
ncbi:MAG: polyprenol monophosphomannose synthase [Actinobacteria bacterium]|nr:polyprenol monophosphomannose synthase [Actinomycetota bacterium]